RRDDRDSEVAGSAFLHEFQDAIDLLLGGGELLLLEMALELLHLRLHPARVAARAQVPGDRVAERLHLPGQPRRGGVFPGPDLPTGRWPSLESIAHLRIEVDRTPARQLGNLALAVPRKAFV